MSRYAEGQTHQLVDALEANKWSADDLTKLGQAKSVQHRAIRDVLNGRAKIVYPQHLINCDVVPFLPDGWSIHEEDQLPNRVHGQLEWNLNKAKLYLSRNQTDGRIIEGNKLRKELAGQSVMSANVLDYLLTYFYFIPEDWKCKAVFFWGTIYRDENGIACVRCLCWSIDKWCCDYYRLGFDFRGGHPAAILAA